jgi:hypothetical protein
MRSKGAKGGAHKRSTVGKAAGMSLRTRRLAAVGAATLVAVPALVFATRGTVVETALAAAIADPASILSARSPGSRGAGALTQTKLKQTKLRQTKPRYARSGVRRTPGPTERVLGQARTRPDGALPLGDAADPILGLPLAVPAGAFSGLGGDGTPATGPGTVAFGGVPITGIGGGGGGGIVVPPTNPTQPPVTAVPEPATWMMTILGFFAAGFGLRRRRRSAAVAAARTAA